MDDQTKVDDQTMMILNNLRGAMYKYKKAAKEALFSDYYISFLWLLYRIHSTKSKAFLIIIIRNKSQKVRLN